MSEKKIDRFIRTVPSVYKPATNPIMRALLEAWGQEHDTMVEQISNTKDQLFVVTAEGQYLDRLASGLGVSRPGSLGLEDSDFQKMIPVFSLEAKNIRKIFYDAVDVFWSPLFSRANIQTTLYEPFNVSPGDAFTVSVDGDDSQTVLAKAGDIATPGAASATEIATILNKISGLVASVITDESTGRSFINIRTETPGPRGSIQTESCTMVSPSKLDFNSKRNRITDLTQRCAIWEVRQNELIIELPAILPSLRRSLRGSHHLHADATLEPPIAPSGGIWAGSFIYSPLGVSYSVTSIKAAIQETLTQGNVYTKVTVDDASLIPASSGLLIFDWGLATEEQPVGYINRPNSATLLLDPGHVFQKTHANGAILNLLTPTLKPTLPRLDGSDLAVYLTSPSSARLVVQNLLLSLAAAGVVVKFEILLPKYEYLSTNPYSGA